MSNLKLRKPQAGFDIANLVVAACLAASPWIVGFADERTAAWNAWFCAALTALAAIAALVRYHEWEEWAAAVIGVWTALSPWALGYVSQAARWTHVIAGVLVLAIAAAEVWAARREPPAKTA